MTPQHLRLHVFTREDRDLHTTVRLHTCVRVVRVDRLFLTAADCGHTLDVEAGAEQEDARGARTALREGLAGVRGVRSVLPLELERGRALLVVEADRDAEAVLARLMRAAPPGLVVTPIYAETAEVGVRVEWSAPAAASDSGKIDTTTPKRY